MFVDGLVGKGLGPMGGQQFGNLFWVSGKAVLSHVNSSNGGCVAWCEFLKMGEDVVFANRDSVVLRLLL